MSNAPCCVVEAHTKNGLALNYKMSVILLLIILADCLPIACHQITFFDRSIKSNHFFLKNSTSNQCKGSLWFLPLNKSFEENTIFLNN